MLSAILSLYVCTCRVTVSVGDEQQIDRMYEMLDSHQKRSAAAAVQSSARRDTRTDHDTGSQPLYSYIN